MLRLAGDRRGKQAPDRRAAEKPDGISPPHATPPDLRGRQSIRWLTSALKQLLRRKVPRRASRLRVIFATSCVSAIGFNPTPTKAVWQQCAIAFTIAVI